MPPPPFPCSADTGTASQRSDPFVVIPNRWPIIALNSPTHPVDSAVCNLPQTSQSLIEQLELLEKIFHLQTTNESLFHQAQDTSKAPLRISASRPHGSGHASRLALGGY